MGITLSQEQRAQLEEITQDGNQSWVKRARIILLDERDLPEDEISRQVELSSSRVRYWIREFGKHGMAIFPPEALPVDWEHVDLDVEPAEPGDVEAAEPDDVEPTELDEVELTEVAKVEPAEPDKVEPTGLGEVVPTEPDEVAPTEVADVEPTDADEVELTELEDVVPTEPDDVEPIEVDKEEPAAQPPAPPPQPTYQDLPEITVGDLCEMHQVDMMHARRVADHSLALFDQTSNVHHMGDESRALLEAAAILHNVGLVANPTKHHTFGRDILLSYQLIGFDELEAKILAFTTALHRKKFRMKRATKEAEMIGLPEEQQDRALRLAALVRIADGLDYSQSQTTTLGEMSRNENEIVFTLSGPFAIEDGMRARSKADLWDTLFEVSIQFSFDVGQATEAMKPEPIRIVTAPTERPKAPGIQSDDWMSEAGRKTLRFHFFRMLDHEAGTRLGEDIEELHDMRVAVRRMRSAIWVFGPYFKKGVLKPYREGLRRTGSALGRVRDLDVFMEKAQAYVDEKSADDGSDLGPLLAAWQSDRDVARERMLKHLDSKQYRGFVQAFDEFLNSEGSGGKRPKKGEPAALRVFQCAPAMIYERDRVVRGYDDALQEASLETLHSLRIDIKRFRYTLEFFREVLGDQRETVIRSAVQMQDHLGDLNDADVACQILIEFLDRWRVEDKREQIGISGITQYLVAKQVELRELVNTFPEMWESFVGSDVRRELALAVAKL